MNVPAGQQQADLAKNAASDMTRFPEGQKVYIITGDWDLLMKLRAENVKRWENPLLTN